MDAPDVAEHYGKEPSRFVQNLPKGEQIYLAYDDDKPTKDRSGRPLAYVYRAPDGLFVAHCNRYFSRTRPLPGQDGPIRAPEKALKNRDCSIITE